MANNVGKTQMIARDLLTAVFFATTAAGLFACMNLSVRALGQQGPDLPVIEITFFRFFFGLLTASSLLFFYGPRVLNTKVPGSHLIRVLAGAGGVTMMFAALASLPVGLVTAVSFSHPFFTLIFAVVVLGEAVGVRRWSAVAVGFLGVVIMMGLPSGKFEPEIGLAVLAAVFFGVEVGMIRKLALTEHFAAILLINNGAALTLLAIPAVLVWQTPSADQWLYLAGTGISAVLGQMLFLSAMRICEASFVAPFGYLTLVYAIGFGYFIFGETPSTSTLIGAVLISGAGLFMVYRESKFQKTE